MGARARAGQGEGGGKERVTLDGGLGGMVCGHTTFILHQRFRQNSLRVSAYTTKVAKRS